MMSNTDQRMPAFDLQLFADDGDDGGKEEDKGTPSGDKGKPGDDGGSGGTKSYTADELEALVSGRLRTAQDKWAADAKKAADVEKRKQERLAKLSDDERKAAEMESKTKELEEKEESLRVKELKYDMAEEMTKRELPGQFIDYLLGKDSGETLENIKKFEKEFKKAVETGVNNRLKGKAPKGGGTIADGKSGSVASFMDAIRKNQAKR